MIFAGTNYAFLHGIPLVTLDKGNYYLLTDQQGNATRIFGRMSGVTLDLADSTLFFRGPYLPNGIQLYQCSNFTLRNFKTDFIHPPYTHVQLTSVDPAARTLGYATLPGWPDPSTFNSLTDPFGENGLWLAVFRNGEIVPGTTRSLVSRPIAANTLTLTQDGTPWTQSSTLATLQPGDTIIVAARGGGPPILVWEGDGVTISNVTIQGSAETAVQFYASKNSTADTVRVVLRPGTGLVGSNGDAIHFASTRQNNHIVNSYVARTLDDGLVMDNQHAALVLSQTPPRQLTVKRDQYLRFPNGTAVNFVDPATTLESSTGAVIVSQNPADSVSPQFNGTVDLTFDRDLPALPAGMAMVYADPLTRGQGSSITDSVAEDIYAGRGIWIAGLQGLTIERNTVRRTSMAGIILSTSTDPFDTGDIGPPAHDVVIQNNVVDGALGPAAGGTGTQVGLGAIQVVSTDNRQFGFASAAGNTNISILDNTIRGSGRSGIWVGEVNSGVIQGNRLIGHNRHPELPIFGIPPPFVAQVTSDFAVPLVVRYSVGVTPQDNVIRSTGGRRDLNGDGMSDLFWSSVTTGDTAAWLMNGSAFSAGAGLPAGAGWKLTHFGDFNGDGRTDLLWHNAATGETMMWLMDGLSVIGGGTLLTSTSWSVIQTGDFDGDGKTDLLWRDSVTGAVVIWLMNGASVAGGGTLLVDPSWTVTHVGDFNGDGKDDLLWRHASGVTAMWLMNGAAFAGGTVLMSDPNWTVTHVGDFNGDGKADIVWRHTSGVTAMWLMNGTSFAGGTGLLSDPNWVVAGVDDLDGDNRADILWRHSVTGDTAAWLMNGTTVVGAAGLLPGSFGYSIAGTTDLNGDGKADILWSNAASGAKAVWLMNGLSILGAAGLLTSPVWMLSP